jgi:PPOX class probable FMN-dependent enzyme
MKRGISLVYSFVIATSTSNRPVFGFTKTNVQSTTSLTQKGLVKRSLSSGSNMGEDGESSWRSLLEVSIARSRKIRGSNYVQISTVKDGEPRCRTVVFRGFQKVAEDHELFNDIEEKSCLMKMCTDKRSKKVSQTSQQKIAEMVWWFPKTSEQYRIRGPLILIGGDTDDRKLEIARKELWGNLSDPARESFLGQVVPGESYEKDRSVIPSGGKDKDGKMLPPPDNFLLMLLDPAEVDYLRLTGDQYRQVDTRSSSGWWGKRVNP